MSKKRKKNDTKETKVEDTSDSNQEMKTGDVSEKDDKEKIPKVKPESLMKDCKKKTFHFRRNLYKDCYLFA